MAKRQRGGNSWKQGYKVYKAVSKFYTNRRTKLERHIRANPNDENAKAALDRPGNMRSKPGKHKGQIAVWDKKANKTIYVFPPYKISKVIHKSESKFPPGMKWWELRNMLYETGEVNLRQRLR